MDVREVIQRVETQHGVARATLSVTTEPERARVFLGHGAGGGVDTPDLLAIRDLLAAHHIATVRVEQPYRVAGGRMETRTAVLDTSFATVVDALRAGAPVFVGGRSTGARIGCRTAQALGAAGVVALAFPLRPKPARDGTVKSRWPELRDAGVPTLVVQGDRDPFGGAAVFPEEGPLPRALVITPVAAADHAFHVARRDGGSRRAIAQVAEAVRGFVIRVIETRG